MAEPFSTTSTAIGAVGLSTLLVGWLGPVAAELTMVILAALAGCAIALSNEKEPRSLAAAFRYVLLGVGVAFIMSSIIAGVVGNIFPSTNTPYSSAMAAFVIGAALERIQSVVYRVLGKG
jgi:predicted membrane channel-forming protein YqfA (hemolysin III family)